MQVTTIYFVLSLSLKHVTHYILFVFTKLTLPGCRLLRTLLPTVLLLSLSLLLTFAKRLFQQWDGLLLSKARWSLLRLERNAPRMERSRFAGPNFRLNKFWFVMINFFGWRLLAHFVFLVFEERASLFASVAAREFVHVKLLIIQIKLPTLQHCNSDSPPLAFPHITTKELYRTSKTQLEQLNI